MDTLGLLEDWGTVLKDRHFVYKSGKHGPHYINMDPVFPDLKRMHAICNRLGLPFFTPVPYNPYQGKRVDTVVGAATGGIPLATLAADLLGARLAWADKDGDDFVFERAGFIEQLAGKRVLVVEDLLNTGDTVKKVIAQVRKHGGEVIGVSVICNRGNETAESLGVPQLEQLASVEFEAFDSWSCPLCAQGIPIVSDIGYGKEYQKMNAGYSGGYVTTLS